MDCKKKADYSFDFRPLIKNLADFNAYNYLCAYALCMELGLPSDEIVTFAKTYVLPLGRIDLVYNGQFKVIVDFAHTPNAVARILETVRKLYCSDESKIIHVFGSAGLRDSEKRPLMGQASGEFADVSIITEEDYRTEDPHIIAEQIAQGIKKWRKEYTIILNRKEAIEHAISCAKPNDLVIITGKGHEKSLCRGTKEYPWSDIDCVKTYVSNQS